MWSPQQPACYAWPACGALIAPPPGPVPVGSAESCQGGQLHTIHRLGTSGFKMLLCSSVCYACMNEWNNTGSLVRVPTPAEQQACRADGALKVSLAAGSCLAGSCGRVAATIRVNKRPPSSIKLMICYIAQPGCHVRPPPCRCCSVVRQPLYNFSNQACKPQSRLQICVQARVAVHTAHMLHCTATAHDMVR